MIEPWVWSAALALLAGCASSPSPGRSEPAVTVASGASRACPAPQGKALDDRHDVDGDGVADLVTHDGLMLHVYVRREGCFESAGSAVLLYAIDDRTAVHVHERNIFLHRTMIHGDVLRTTYGYDDGRLVRLGKPALVPGPHATSSSSGRP